MSLSSQVSDHSSAAAELLTKNDELAGRLSAASLHIASLEAQAVTDKADVDLTRRQLAVKGGRVGELEQSVHALKVAAAKALSEKTTATTTAAGTAAAAAAAAAETLTLREACAKAQADAADWKRQVDELIMCSTGAISKADQAEADTYSLQRRVSELEGVKVYLEEQVRSNVQEMEALRRAATEWEAHRREEEETDDQRLQYIRAVNQHLAAFAADTTFQADLNRPFVKIALDCWGGEHIDHYTEAQLHDCRHDEGVVRVYDRLRAFEHICDEAAVKFPIDHLTLRLSELSEEAVKYSYGVAFCHKHHLLGALKKRGISLGRIRTWRGTPSGSPYGSPDATPSKP